MLGSSLESKYMESAPFGLTETAATKIGKLLIDEGEPQNAFMRVAVDGGGCSGFQYDFSFVSSPNSDDLIFKERGINYLVDKISMDFLNGSTLEYISELAGAYFKIVNPNATANCGCRTSFSI